MDVVMKHQNTKDQPQNSLLGDEILHRCSTVFSLDLAEVKKNNWYWDWVGKDQDKGNDKDKDKSRSR